MQHQYDSSGQMNAYLTARCEGYIIDVDLLVCDTICIQHSPSGVPTLGTRAQ